MEPMNLGTPSNSGPSSPVTTPGGSQFLPSFLLGEPQPGAQASTSPKLKRNGLSESGLFTSPRNNLSQTAKNPQHNHYTSLSNEKSQGPPIKGLFDSLSTSHLESPLQVSQTDSNYASILSKNYYEITPFSNSTKRAADLVESTWVTVFGYPPAAASYILSQMSQCGRVANTRVPATGNWMHVQFTTKLEVKRALANNGKVFSGNVMIGVISCRDQNITTNGGKENVFSPSMANPLLSPLSNDVSTGDNAVQFTFSSPPRRFASARSLTSLHDTEVYSGINTPQKKTGIVSKAMEYVFGW